MILMYPKVHPESSSIWWVTPNEFWRQMEELKRYRVVYLDEYDPSNPNHVVITFDGVYENVFTYAFPILKKFAYPFELFIIGDVIGKNNDFDHGEPQANFANSRQLQIMVRHGGRLQWHSWSHKNLAEIRDRHEIETEINIPKYIRELDAQGFSWFAYPYGRWSSLAWDYIKKNFKGALLCEEGELSDLYKLKRITVTNKTRFSRSTVSLIIPNYNYGRFAAEAIESALHQTVAPDEILFIDDCSTDNSLEVANRYKDKIRIVKNEKNLGIVDNFNKAVSLTSGDYICFLGADNRLRSDYIEKCKFALDSTPDAAIAYTNVVIFGPRAEILATKVGATPIAGQKDIFLWRFPEFTEEAKKILKVRNFIHGSSMYRRSAFMEVGGYKKSNGPEDHNLFLRIIEKGWKAVLCPEFLLEYRQHSNEQANITLYMGLELAFLRRQYNNLIRQLPALIKNKKIIQETIDQVSIYAHQGKIDEAMERIRETMLQFPEHGKLLLQYALLLKLKGVDEEAKKFFEQALLYNPNLIAFGENFKYPKLSSPQDESSADKEQKYYYLKTYSAEYPKPDADSVTLLEKGSDVEVSIIIPVHNQFKYTKNCLKSIYEHTKIPFEIIVVDNASSDETKEYLLQIKETNLRPLFMEQNLGFGNACNQGAKNAKGKYIIFLNNDTEVTSGWLEPLINLMEEMKDCGAVGSKLIYPDGRLQEAGGIIFSDGQGWNYGRGMDPADPKFNFVREVDYCSAAALMIRKSLWNEIGGFDPRYAPAYYEDTDFCFEIRKRGYKVYYQPKSIIIHHEGKTAGTDLNSGYKRYQEINRIKFCQKWKNELKKQYPNQARYVVCASDRQAKKNILVIDAFLPFYDRASGSLRLFQILKILKKMKFHITFLARDGSLEKQYRPILEEMGIEVYAGDYKAMKAAGYKNNPWRNIPYDHLFQYRSYDYALIEFWWMADFYLPIIRKLSPQTKIIIDSVDIHFIREIREAELAQNSELKSRAMHNKEKEIAIYKQADRVWVVTETDKNALLPFIENKPIDIIPNIHETIPYRKSYAESSDLLFIGNFNHPPNRDAVIFFYKKIYPIIQQNLPDVKLYIIGNNPPEEVKALASAKIIVTGYVQDLTPYLKKARISINPLRYGAGMKGKIGEALSWGLPVVTTSIGAEGMGLVDGQEALIANSPQEFAQKVVQLYQDPILWKKLSDNGRIKVEANWTPKIISKRLEEIFESEKLQIRANLVSIIIPVYNQLEYSKKCLESIFRYTDVPFELIIVDNGSRDLTPKYLKEIREGKESIAGWSFFGEENGKLKDLSFAGEKNKKKKKVKRHFYCQGFKVILNETNLGFAAGNNRGIAEAKGNYILLMNNDVVVTPGWLKRMIAVAERKPEIGIVGPMSNYVSGPQLLKDIKYNPVSLDGLHQFAKEHAQENHGRAKPFYRVVGFCMLIKRAVIEKIGGLDERYGLGNFEDDDFCLRASLAGFESWIAEDCFVHHFGHRTFLGENINYEESLNKNWEIFKKKWGIPLEIELETKYDLNWIFRQKFDPLRHYYPICAHKLSISHGEALFNMGDTDGAQDIFQRIISTDPQNIEALNNLGVIHFQKGDIEQAIYYFNQVLNLQGNHAEALENLGKCFIAQGNFEDAIPLLNKALNFRPKDINLLNSLANCFINLGNFARAEELYKQSYHLNNNQTHVQEIIKELTKMREVPGHRSMMT